MRRKSQFPHTATLFTATVGQYLRSVRGCRPTPREDLGCGTCREPESLSNPAGQWHLSAAPGWRKTSFTYENQTLLHRFFLFPMSFILFIAFSFSVLPFPSRCRCLCHISAGNGATGFQRSGFKMMPWCLSVAKSKALCGWKRGDALAGAEGCTPPTASSGRRGLLSRQAAQGSSWQKRVRGTSPPRLC